MWWEGRSISKRLESAWWPVILHPPPRETVSPRVWVTRKTAQPWPAFSPRVPAASGPLARPVSHWLQATEKENSPVSIPRGPDWRQRCSGMSLLAEKFNYISLTRPKLLCSYSASLLSSPVLVTSRSVRCRCGEQEDGAGPGLSEFPQEENRLCASFCSASFTFAGNSSDFRMSQIWVCMAASAFIH